MSFQISENSYNLLKCFYYQFVVVERGKVDIKVIFWHLGVLKLSTFQIFTFSILVISGKGRVHHLFFGGKGRSSRDLMNDGYGIGTMGPFPEGAVRWNTVLSQLKTIFRIKRMFLHHHHHRPILAPPSKNPSHPKRSPTSTSFAND